VPELSYQAFDSPLGNLLVAATDEGICAIEFGRSRAVLADLSVRLGRTPRLEPGLRPIVQALKRYLRGGTRELDLPVDLTLATPFGRRVLRRLMKVGFGELTSYLEIARAIGSSPRAVGGAVGSNPVPIVVPCHRVVAADGSLGGYSAGLDRKRTLLKLEGHRDLRGGWPPRRASQLTLRG
jgi:methylated-DNA-[protein]-cysteine S-methyltransferase